jgi:hypothetical protein
MRFPWRAPSRRIHPDKTVRAYAPSAEGCPWESQTCQKTARLRHPTNILADNADGLIDALSAAPTRRDRVRAHRQKPVYAPPAVTLR